MKASIQSLAVAGILACLSPLAGAEAINVPAPDFTLESRSGENLRLEDHRGEVVMLNFWASWCGPCRQEMPLMDELYSQYKDLGFTILAVNVDENREEAHVQAMPTTVMIDRDGNARYLHYGYQPGYEDEYEQQIRELVRE